MTQSTDAQLLRDIEEHVRKMWDARLLPASCWPAELAQRLSNAVKRREETPFDKSSISQDFTQVHPDDAAVDALATAMKAKLAKQRAKGYGGWDDKVQCSQQFLSALLRRHVDKGDPVDVANFCAFLLARGEAIAAAPQAVQAAAPTLAELEASAELGALRDVYEMARGVLRFDGVDLARAIKYKDDLIEAIETVKTIDGGTWEPAHPAEEVPAPMLVAQPHHCTARTADGSCEECEGHAQAMAEWNAERAAIAAAQPAAQEDKVLLDFLQDQSIDLRCFSSADGEGVYWRTIQHHMGEPHERVASEVYKDDPRQAVREAMTRLARDPYCTGPLHEDDAALAAQAKQGGA